jgi:curved DNA-binding protein CbpA
VSEDESHYEVLGVEPGATKDEIRDAYREQLADAQGAVTDAETAKRPEGSKIASARAEEARVRSAWQVLSDPVQRARHDESLGVEHDPTVAVDEPDDGDDDESAALTPRQQRAAARAGATTRDGRPRPPGMFSAEHPDPPASWPPGLRPPPPRARILALLVDVLVLALLIVLQQTVGGLLIDKAYPAETKRLDRIETCLDRLSTANDDLDAPKKSASIDRANTACAKLPAVYGEPLGSDESKKQLEKRIDNRTGDMEDAQADARSDLLPGQLILSLVTILVALLYLVPSTLKSGRTLGKSLFRLRLVNADGSAIRFRGATLHYGVPVMVALLFAPILGPVGYVAVLFGVLTWPRNANYQGLHDRLAGTIVVDG